MSERERRHPRPEPTSAVPDGNGPPLVAHVDDIRANAERLLAAADEAIGNTLSQDSAAFLAANQQRGGQ